MFELCQILLDFKHNFVMKVLGSGHTHTNKDRKQDGAEAQLQKHPVLLLRKDWWKCNLL